MVARPLGQVKWFAALGLASLLVQGDSAARRLPPAEEFTETGIVTDDRRAGDVAVPSELRFQLGEDAEQVEVEAALAGFRGLGTVADPILLGPAGVRVHLVGGDLVWHAEFLPHGVPETRLAFSMSYDHQAAEETALVGGSVMPPGWRHAYQRSLQPGSWGQMELLEDDGFVHRFHLLGEDTTVQRDALIDTLVQMRRSGRAPPGDPIPIGPAFRRNMEEDPEYLDDMRARFLGGGGGAGTEDRYGSRARGHAVLWTEADGAAVLRRHDGTVETFGPDGGLLAAVPPAGPELTVERDRDGIAAVSLDLGPRLQLERDGGGRLVRVSGAAGREIRLEYVAGQLSAVRAPEGTWAFGYDEDGQSLVSIAGPRDWVRIEYDGDKGRVVSLEGPHGVTRVQYTPGRPVVSARATGPAGTVEVSLDGSTGERVVRTPHGTSVVRFDGALQRPVEVDGTALRWDDAGHIVALAGPAGALSVQVDDQDRPTRIMAPGGAVAVEFDEQQRLQSATDDEGIRHTFEYDGRGRLVRETVGGRSTSLRRGLWDEIERVTLPGGESYGIRRDAAGRPEGLRGPGGDDLQLRWDAADRLTAVEAPGAQAVSIHRGARGGVTVRDHRGNAVRTDLGVDGRLAAVARETPASRLVLEADGGGLPVQLRDDRGWTLRVTRDGGQVTALDGGPGGDVRAVHGEHGLDEITVAGVRWVVSRDVAGRPVRLVGDGGRDLRVRYDGAGSVVEVARGLRVGYRAERGAAGRVGRVDPASGEAWTLGRNARGRVTSVVRDDEVIRIERDSRGRATAVLEGDAEHGWRVGHGLADWPDGVTAPGGRRWALGFDARGWLEGYTTPAGAERTAVWGLWGDPESLSPETGGLALTYDPSGAVSGVRAAGHGEWTCRWSGSSAELVHGGGARALMFDGHGRWLSTVPADGEGGEQRAELGPAGALVAWVRGDLAWSAGPDHLGRPRWLGPLDGPPAVEWSWGADGLLSGWTTGEGSRWIQRDALGRPVDGVLAAGGAKEVPSELVGRLRPAARRAPAVAILLGPYLPEVGGEDRDSPVGPTTPRWVEDRLRAQQHTGWAAALPAPPGEDLPLPGVPGLEEVTVAGLLTLLGFLPDDLAAHRTLVSAPATPVTLRCPAVGELRALHARWSGAVGAGAVALDPALRGVVRLPDGAPVGHPVAWAAVDDPWTLRDPASELLGVSGVPPAVAGLRRGDDGAAPGVDEDPLAAPLRAALDDGRWLSSAPAPALGSDVGPTADWAGGIGLWTAARVQVVVDGRGRLRGLDVGSTATAVWNRRAVARWLGPAVTGEPPAGGLLQPPLWLPSPGHAPERSLGLRPGPGPLWPDPAGDVRVVR